MGSLKNKVKNGIGNTQTTEILSNVTRTIGEKREDNIPISKLYEAPKELHKFKPLSEDQRLEIRMSIINNGLYEAIHVWEQLDGTYMILAGHNRTSIYKELYEETGDVKYATIPAIVYPFESLKDDIQRKKAIIYETNIFGRNKFTVEERIDIVMYRMDFYKKSVDKDGKNIVELGESLGLKKSTIYDDYKIGLSLIPEMQEYYYRNKINRKTALQLTRLDKDVQEYLIFKYPKKILTKYLYDIPVDVVAKEDFDKFFLENEKAMEIKRKEYKIPKEYEKEFEEYVKVFLEEKGLI